MKISDHIVLHPTPKAKGRTKNRIREHGESGFIIKRMSGCVRCLEQRPAFLLESISKNSSGGEAWRGWLPCEEIEVKVIS